MTLVSIIIPVFNEEKNIGKLLERIIQINANSNKFSKEIIVINDGSTDKSKEIIQKFQKVILINQENFGKGKAVQTGIKQARGEFILIQDGDLEYNPNDIIKMIDNVQINKKMSVYGSRYKPFYLNLIPKFYRKQNISSYIANIIFVLQFLLFYQRFISDPLTGYKLYPKKFFEDNKINSNGFEADHEISAKLIKQNYKIIEVPIQYIPRTKAEGKKINFMDALKAFITIIRYRFTN